jgi:Ferritin-like domain
LSKHRNDIQASEVEITRMTRDLTDLHGDVTEPAMRAGIAEWSEGIRSAAGKATNRRSFLLGVGGVLASTGILATVISGPGLAGAAQALSSTTGSGPDPEAGLSGDLAVAALAASLENLAVYTYQAAITAAGAGTLGPVPPAIATFATTVMAQHSQHAAAWNSLLTAAGKPKVTVTDPTLTPSVKQQLGQLTNVTQVGQLALMLENTAAQTYQAEASKLKSAKAVAVAATIQPVEMQHAAILYYVLGEYPGIQTSSGTPLAFNPTDLAA